MNEQMRTIFIQELHTLKIELDRGNKYKNQQTELIFTITEDRKGHLKVFATTGAAAKLIIQKVPNLRWESDPSNQFLQLGNWFKDALKYEVDHNLIKSIIREKINQLFRG